MSTAKRDWKAESKMSSSSSVTTTATTSTSSSFKSERRQKKEMTMSKSLEAEGTSVSTTQQQHESVTATASTSTSTASSNTGGGVTMKTAAATRSVEKKASVTSSSSAGLGIGLSRPKEEPKAIAAAAPAGDGKVPTSQRNGTTVTHTSAIKVAVNQQNGNAEDESKQGNKERSESPPPLECEKEAEEKKKRDRKKKKKKDKSALSGKESIRAEGASRIIKSRIDRDKVAKKFSKVTPEDMGNSMCHMCGKQVFQMEQVKAERAVWHRSCFRCKECQKQLTVDTYQSHEGELYCKPHFKQLFQPKVVLEEEGEAPKRRPRLKNELIICESEPVALPDDVVRCTDKPDYGLDELVQVADVKSKFKAFENWSQQQESQESAPSAPVKRSASILKQIARFQHEDGIEFSDEGSEDEEESDDDAEEDGENKETRKKKKMASAESLKFEQVTDIKSKWEGTQLGRKEINAEKRREEQIRVRQLMLRGKNESVKAMYKAQIEQQQTEGQSKRNSVIIDMETSAKSIKDKFEKGEELNADAAEKRKSIVPDLELFTAADTAKGARNLFRKIDATVASKPSETVTSPKPRSDVEKKWVVSQGLTAKTDAEIVRSSDIPPEMDQVKVDTNDIASRFKFFETYKEPERAHRQFRITPPREGQEPENQEEEPEPEPTEKPAVSVVRSDTARKMLSKFRELEEKAIREQMYEGAGPKPLKSFTPPPEDYSDDEDYSGSDYEDGEDEDDEEYEDEDDFEDEALKEAYKARRAQSLREKFEQWDDVARKNQMNTALLEEAETLPSLDTTKNLRAKFESLHKEQAAPKEAKPKVHVNRFV